jgi:hypothetical protein
MKKLITLSIIVFFLMSCEDETLQGSLLNDSIVVNTYIEPENNATCTGLNTGNNTIEVVMSWNPFTTGDDTNVIYTVTIVNILTDASQVLTTVGENTVVASLATGESYNWYVTATSIDGQNVTGETWQFETPFDATSNHAPYPALMLTPDNNSSGNATNVNLTWDGSDPDSGESSSLTFNIYLGTTNPPALLAPNISTEQLSVTLNPSTTYFWSVKSIDVNGNASFSEVWSFSTN